MEKSQGPVTKLPAELLDIILLHVVRTKADDDHTQSLCCEQLNAIRLVCRQFYESSWKAYARVVESTAFDFRSKASMQALEAMSLHPRICPLIKRLGFGYYYAVRSEVGDDTRCNQEEVDQVRMIDARWYPDVWSLTHVSHQATDPLPLQTQQQVADATGLILLVARSLRKFGPLEEVRYYNINSAGWRIPPRYAGIVTNHAAMYDSYSAYTDYAAQLGLEILLRALAESGQTPTRIDLAITSNHFHTFVCETPRTLIKQIMRRTEDLQVSCDITAGTYAPDGERLNQVVLSKATFPSLRHLSINGSSDWPYHHAVPLPQGDQTPALETLTASLTTGDPVISLDFISRYAANTRKLVLRNYTEHWVPLLELLATIRIEMLELTWDGEYEEPPQFDDFLFMLHGVNERMLSQAANQVIITPVGFRDGVLAHFEGPKEFDEWYTKTYGRQEMWSEEESDEEDYSDLYRV